jgi:hypothetical protein
MFKIAVLTVSASFIASYYGCQPVINADWSGSGSASGGYDEAIPLIEFLGAALRGICAWTSSCEATLKWRGMALLSRPPRLHTADVLVHAPEHQ